MEGPVSDEEFERKLKGRERITRADLLDRSTAFNPRRVRAVAERIGAQGYAGHRRDITDLYWFGIKRNFEAEFDQRIDRDAFDVVAGFALGASAGCQVADDQRGWERDPASVVHYMDNSVEVEYVAGDGGRKRVTEVPPHGDACF